MTGISLDALPFEVRCVTPLQFVRAARATPPVARPAGAIGRNHVRIADRRARTRVCYVNHRACDAR